MFHPLQEINDHPCYEMQDILVAFFRESINETAFSKNIFPLRLRNNWNRLSTFVDDLEELYNEIRSLPLLTRQLIEKQFLNNNQVQTLCEQNLVDLEDSIEWKEELGGKISNLTGTCYLKLDLTLFRRTGCNLKPTKRYYQDFIRKNRMVCPFCGLNTYKNPNNIRREDFDHYLNKADYPFAAANMRNLVPMCVECNEAYKRDINIIFENLNRVVAFYPYGVVNGVDIEITCNNYPTINDRKGRWSTNIVPKNATEILKITNWDRVFHVKERMANEIKEYYQEWIDKAFHMVGFNDVAGEANFRTFFANQALIAQESAYRKMEPREYLRSAFFDFIANHAEDVFVKSFLLSYRARLAPIN